MELTSEDVKDLLTEISEHDQRIKKLETEKHVCGQLPRLCEIERTQKDVMDKLDKLQKTQDKTLEDITKYKDEAQKQTKTMIAGFIGIIVTVIITSISLYRDVINTLDAKFTKTNETLDTKFIKTYEIINAMNIYMNKNIKEEK
jgi:hypothetical protein